MSISKKVADVFKPTFPRILMYMAFTFLVPTFLKVCTDEGCVWKLKFLAGYRLFMKEETGILTFGTMLLLFITAYVVAAVTASAFNALKRKQQEI